LKDERKRCGWKGEAKRFSRTRVRGNGGETDGSAKQNGVKQENANCGDEVKQKRGEMYV